MLIMCAVRSADGRWTTAPPTLPRRTEISPSVSRRWIASRNAGGLTPNSANRLPATEARRLLSTARTGCRPAFAAATIRPPAVDESAVRGSELLARRLPSWKPVSLSGRRPRVDLADAQHLVVEQQPGRRGDVPVGPPRARCRTAARSESASAGGRYGQRPGLARKSRGAVLVLDDAVEEHREKAAVDQSRRAFVDERESDSAGGRLAVEVIEGRIRESTG